MRMRMNFIQKNSLRSPARVKKGRMTISGVCLKYQIPLINPPVTASLHCSKNRALWQIFFSFYLLLTPWLLL